MMITYAMRKQNLLVVDWCGSRVEGDHRAVGFAKGNTKGLFGPMYVGTRRREFAMMSSKTYSSIH